MVLYTDGLTEAGGKYGEMFGDDRLRDIVRIRGDFRSF
ncbi:MAG TPA: hypothetical protein ENK58_00605 [Desulfobacterales bacterium]|nr:hypothetical protein [Desulfobacterales bacterium]